jgi:SAM-dependent methyltransferase
MFLQNRQLHGVAWLNGVPRLASLVARIPVLGPVARALARRTPLVEKLLQKWKFANSSTYWEQRYLTGGTSGAGSYGRLAQFKAETLNAFASRADIQRVIEFGCGDGEQLALAQYPSYVGVDVSPTSIALCTRRFASDRTKRFYLATKVPEHLGRFDLALSLDVIYHLVEDAALVR